MTVGVVTRVAMQVEIDGKAYAVALPQERLLMLAQLAESLSDNGKLPVCELPGTMFQEQAR